MRADDLHQAVVKIAGILESVGIRAAVDRFRNSGNDDRTAAAASLERAGATVAERFHSLDVTGRQVLQNLHLDALANAEYWRELVANASRPGPGAGEIVRLGVRLMFASQNLPGLSRLLAATGSAVDCRFPLREGEARLLIRLADAGERACDPDRVARSIDGIDMLYSACASITRRPIIDLRLEAVDGSVVRDMHFSGSQDAVNAVVAVLDSIPEALSHLDEEADIDLDAVVESLPVFADLRRLASLGSFTEGDLKDIVETLHQGALLALESGVVRVAGSTTSATARSEAPVPAAVSSDSRDNEAMPASSQRQHSRDDDKTSASSGAVVDRHYEEYLRERAAMQGEGSVSAALARKNGQADTTTATPVRSTVDPARAAVAEAVTDPDGLRRNTVEELLKSLGNARDD